MTKTTYRVLRQHLGDRMYQPGEEREAEAADVAHLVASGVLGEGNGAGKAEKAEPVEDEPARRGKAKAGAPENK